MQAITIGGAIIDIVVSGVRSEHFAGSKEDVDAITLGIGGGAVNASFAIQASGMAVGIVCALGDDGEAQLIRSVLERARVDLSRVQTVAGQPTGKAVIQIDQKGEATVFAQRGASTLVSLGTALDVKQASLFYVTALSARAEAELAESLSQQKPLTAPLVINPGMGQIASCSAAFAQILSCADLVCLNESEARMLARKRNVALPEDMKTASATLLSQLKAHDKQAFLITLGARGALFCDNVGDLHGAETRRVDLRSTLGAGDAFCATFASHWVRGEPAQTALAAAQAYCTEVLQSVTANLVTKDGLIHSASR